MDPRCKNKSHSEKRIQKDIFLPVSFPFFPSLSSFLVFAKKTQLPIWLYASHPNLSFLPHKTSQSIGRTRRPTPTPLPCICRLRLCEHQGVLTSRLCL